MIKFAEISNTSLAPAAGPTRPAAAPKAVIRKMGGMGHLVHDGHPKAEGVYEPEEGPGCHDYVHGENVKKLPQMKLMTPHVDVTAQEPPTKMREKKASVTALPGQYPLDSYEQVKAASVYFDEWKDHFSIEDRRTYAINMVKRANELGIPVSDIARKYGAETLAPVEELKVAFAARRALLSDAGAIETLNDLERLVLQVREGVDNGVKVAAMGHVMTPEVLSETLGQFDQQTGLAFYYETKYVPDPFFSVYGVEKTAAFSETIGNQTVTADDLEFLAKNRIHLVKGTFDLEMAKEFKTDPVGIYKSLPVAQRKILANLAKSMNSSDPVV